MEDKLPNIASMKMVNAYVCLGRGHQIAIQEYPATVKDEGGYEKEVPAGFVERCIQCGATLEEIRSGNVGGT